MARVDDWVVVVSGTAGGIMSEATRSNWLVGDSAAIGGDGSVSRWDEKWGLPACAGTEPHERPP